MKSLFIFFILALSVAAHSETMPVSVKEYRIKKVLKEDYAQDLKGYTVGNIDIIFRKSNWMFAVPVYGQVLALSDYAGRGDQDHEVAEIQLTKGNKQRLLSCYLNSARYYNEGGDVETATDIVWYTVILERCELDGKDIPTIYGSTTWSRKPKAN